MRRFTSIKVIAVLAITVAVIYSAYRRTTVSLKELVETARESSKPDIVLIKVKEMNTDVADAESGIRAFTITQDVNYLDPYKNLAATIDKKLDTLRQLTSEKKYQAASVDSISVLMKKKLTVYNDLLGINRGNILQTLGKITNELPEKDSVTTDTLINYEKKKSFLKKLFGTNGLSKKELQEKADSAVKENEANKEKITNVQKTIADIQQTESQQLKEQTKKELALLNTDKQITLQIATLIRKIETDEYYHAWQKTENANLSAEQSGNSIKLLILSGALLILLLIVLILYDITKSNQYRKELAEAKSHAEKLAKIKEEFLANMSHEIRTPLSGILGYTDRLLKANLNNKQINYAQAIQTSAEHLLSIVNDILDLTKIETGHLRFEKINFNPEKIIKEVCAAMRLKADEKNLELKCITENISGVNVIGDPLRLKQILFNLIGNAIKFTEKGKVEIEAVAAARSRNPIPNSQFQFQISDTGIGIAQEEISNIFTQFSQADSSTSRKFGGSGLGLSISKKIIEQLGGTIQVKSEIGKGSAFIFSLPYEIAENTDAGITNISNKNFFTSNIHAPLQKKLAGIKILLAEDVEINRILQVQILKDLGADVTEAANGFEVIGQLPLTDCQLILMDVQMPGMSGVEALKQIRESMNSAIPVIAVTANVMQNDLQRYMQAGFNDYITKPFKEEELVEKILNVLHIDSSLLDEMTEEKNIAATDIFFYDLNELIKASNGNTEFVIKMIKLFIKNSEDELKNMETVIVQNDYGQLSNLAHKLIPSYKHFSINLAVTLLQKLEQATNNLKSRDEIKNIFEEVKLISAKIISEMKNDLKKLEHNSENVTSS